MSVDEQIGTEATASVPVATTVDVPVAHHSLIHRLIALIEKDYEAVRAFVETEEAKL